MDVKDIMFQQSLTSQNTSESSSRTVENSSKESETKGTDTNTSDDDKPIDEDSARKKFGWTVVDEVSIPCILRKSRKFVSVRIIDRKLLSKYPDTFPDELSKKEPLVSYFITEAEANLLNEINTVHCENDYGTSPFTVKDTIVDLEEFVEYFDVVKKTFPEEVLESIKSSNSIGTVTNAVSVKSLDLSQHCGWVRINDTVLPFVNRIENEEKVRLVPLSVILHAAELSEIKKAKSILPTLEECVMLNETCKMAGINFNFAKTTRLVSIREVEQRCQVKICDLPFNKPYQHAQYMDKMSAPVNFQKPPSHLNYPMHNPFMLNLHLNHQIPPSAMPTMPGLYRGRPPKKQQERDVTPPSYHFPGKEKQITDGFPSVAQQQYWHSIAQSVRHPYTHQNSTTPPVKNLPMRQESQVPNYFGFNPALRHPNPVPYSQPGIRQLVYNTQVAHTPPPAIDNYKPNFHHSLPSINNSIESKPSNYTQGIKQRNDSFVPPIGIERRLSNDAAKEKTIDHKTVPNTYLQNPNAVPHSSMQQELKITACLVKGKSISCINLNYPNRNGNFCLVEAVSKLYFPTKTIVEFVNVLQAVLHVELHDCTEEEESAFVKYYNLPVNKLKCNKMIKVSDLEEFFPQLNYMFTECPPGSSPEPSPTKSSRDTGIKRQCSTSKDEGPSAKVVPKLENVVQMLHQQQASPGSKDTSVIVIDD